MALNWIVEVYVSGDYTLCVRGARWTVWPTAPCVNNPLCQQPVPLCQQHPVSTAPCVMTSTASPPVSTAPCVEHWVLSGPCFQTSALVALVFKHLHFINHPWFMSTQILCCLWCLRCLCTQGRYTIEIAIMYWSLAVPKLTLVMNSFLSCWLPSCQQHVRSHAVSRTLTTYKQPGNEFSWKYELGGCNQSLLK